MCLLLFFSFLPQTQIARGTCPTDRNIVPSYCGKWADPCFWQKNIHEPVVLFFWTIKGKLYGRLAHPFLGSKLCLELGDLPSVPVKWNRMEWNGIFVCMYLYVYMYICIYVYIRMYIYICTVAGIGQGGGYNSGGTPLRGSWKRFQPKIAKKK